jgi:hypothetical protein
MRIKLGIIGDHDTVKKIVEVAEEFNDKVDIFPHSYEYKEETLELLNKCQDKVDVIIFSGHVPYFIAKFANAIKKPAVYIPRVGTSILKAFWEINSDGIDCRRISIDSVKENSVDEITKELNITIERLYVISYEENISYDELAERHYKLWKDNKINAAVVGLTKTYERLKKLGVPVYKLMPTTFLIREYINKAIYEASVKKIKATQVAIKIVKIKNRNSNMSSEYEFLKIKNKLEKALIEYTKNILGSVFPLVRDEYLIFATRGAIDNELNTSEFQKHVEIEGDLGITFASGIGYGNTVYNAEFNARIALDYAMKKDYSCLYVVDQQGTISGPISNGSDELLTYELAATDKKVQLIADKLNISPAYVSKIMAIIQKTCKNTFDAEELSNYLGVSTRSARRILNTIVDGGYGEVIAKESKAKTGRPRQIFEIKI